MYQSISNRKSLVVKDMPNTPTIVITGPLGNDFPQTTHTDYSALRHNLEPWFLKRDDRTYIPMGHDRYHHRRPRPRYEVRDLISENIAKSLAHNSGIPSPGISRRDTTDSIRSISSSSSRSSISSRDSISSIPSSDEEEIDLGESVLMTSASAAPSSIIPSYEERQRLIEARCRAIMTGQL